MKKILFALGVTIALAGCAHQTTTPVAAPTTMDSGMTMNMGSLVTSEASFIANMIPHHEEAVTTANIILQKSQNAQLKILAQGIVQDQTAEITEMNGRLSKRYSNVRIATNYTPMMRDLTQLTGDVLDRTFMEDMIKHHQGAIDMAQKVLTLSPRPEVAQLANNIITSQTQQITDFQDMLAK